MEGLVNDLVSFAEAFFTNGEGKPPLEVAYLWEWFKDVHVWRGYDRTNDLPNLLTLDVIKDWAMLTETDVGQFELDVFMRLEGAYWDSMIPKEQKSSLFGDLKMIAESEKKIHTVPRQKAK